MITHELPFKLNWLVSVGVKKPDVAVCPNGHLLITNRTCWAPDRFAPDLEAVFCRMVDACDAVTRKAP